MAKKLTTEYFIEKARTVHGDTYDYSKVVYVDSHTKVPIIDPEFGEFMQSPHKHLSGQGNPDRKKYISSKVRSSNTQEFIQKAKMIHGSKYDYTKTVYKNAKTKVCIIDPIFGEFWQTPNNHLSGKGSDSRARFCNNVGQQKGTEQILKEAFHVHGSKYIYYKSTIGTMKKCMVIECVDHGKFTQKPEKHLTGQGCPKCANVGPSKPEQTIYDHVVSICPDAVQSDRSILNGKELDIYVPSKNLAIEYCGLYWHSEEMGKDKSYHFDKWKECHDKGIHLLTIFEDEDSDKVLNAVNSHLGVRTKGVYARKLSIREVPTKAATSFLNQHHLQGSCGKKVTLGAYDGEELVAVMAFGATSRQSAHPWELRRFCTDGRNHPGVASRLWKSFLRDYSPTSVVSMSDRRWFSGGMYKTLGFDWDGEVRPDYAYIRSGERFHKSGFRRAGIKARLPDLYVEELTEREMMQNAGYGRIWDCGKDRWVWNNAKNTK